MKAKITKLQQREPEVLFMRNYKTLLEQRDIRHVHVVEHLGVKQCRYNAWMEGRANPPLFFKLKIAELLDVPLITLLTEQCAA